MIDCTVVIETVIKKLSEGHVASIIQSTSDNVKSQQKQITGQQNQIKDMVAMVTSIASLIRQKFKGESNSTNIGLSVPDLASPPIDVTVYNEAQSTSRDDQVSIQASNLFFQRVDHLRHKVRQILVIKPKKMTGLTHLVRILIRPIGFPLQINMQTKSNMDQKCLHPQPEQHRCSGKNL